MQSNHIFGLQVNSSRPKGLNIQPGFENIRHIRSLDWLKTQFNHSIMVNKSKINLGKIEKCFHAPSQYRVKFSYPNKLPIYFFMTPTLFSILPPLIKNDRPLSPLTKILALDNQSVV